MKILLTGANGLLGRCFTRELKAYGHEVTIGGNNDLSNDAIKIDITDYANVCSVLDDGDFSHVINCAADRDPESCLHNPLRAYAINAVGVENLARACTAYDICLCHISTDYVFDDNNPPYREAAPTHPLNTYGRSKLAGELAAQTVAKHLVLRIPALYRTDITDPKNLVNKLYAELTAGNEIILDNVCSRFYTLADEIAHAGVLLLQTNRTGIVHLGAEERTTKAEFARIFARSKGFSESLIVNLDTIPATTEQRPEDSQLNTELFKSISDFRFSGPTAVFNKV